MFTQNFKPGDVVHLKSGGAQMTVAEIEIDKVTCEWLDKQDRPQRFVWNLSVLERVTTPTEHLNRSVEYKDQGYR
jgi:uncharacterized protein YodC (DUF2158 family)